MKYFWTTLGALVILMCSDATALDAPSELRPTGLSPGDTYFVIFVANASRNQNHCTTLNTADIDSHGSDAAAAGSVTSGVTGWQSLYIHEWSGALGVITDTVAAAGPAFNNVVDRPIYNTMLQLVANDRTDLFDGSTNGAGTALINTINFDEDGNAYQSGNFAYTGFDERGDRSAGATLGYSGTGCLVGDPDTSNSNWSATGNSNASRSIYVLSPLLTIPAAAAPGVSAFPKNAIIE